MEIVSVQPEHTDALLAIYRAQVANAPHCRFVPEPARFCDELLGNILLPASLFDRPLETKVLVAEEAGKPQGFVCFHRYHHWNEGEREAIAGLFFADEAAGDALILACEAMATNNEIGAFPRFHGLTGIHSYNGGWDGLSDRVPNVAHVLVRHGYRPYFRELNLITPTLKVGVDKAVLSPGLRLVHSIDPNDQQGRKVQAMDGDEEVGICIYSTLAPLTDNEEASHIGYVWWLHVSEAYRQRGIARSLMAATFEQLTLLGCTSCWLTTTCDNWRAQPLYYSLGFDMVDCSVSFHKTIKESTLS